MVANYKRLIEYNVIIALHQVFEEPCYVCSLSLPQLSHRCTSLKGMMRYIESCLILWIID